jgi:hypothetical protein
MSTENNEIKEVSFKEFIFQIKGYVLEIWRNKWLVALCCVPFFIWKAYAYTKMHPTYPAALTFMIDDGKGGGGFGLGGILSSISGEETVKEYDKIIALSKSMTIIKDVMLSKATLNGKEDFVGNHLIRVEKVDEEIWSKEKEMPGADGLRGFLFTRDSFDRFSRKEYSAMKTLQALMNGSEDIAPIFRVSYNETSGILTYQVACRTEEMSILLLNTFFEKLSTFYTEKAVGKNYMTYKVVKAKADSLKRALNSIETRQAQFEDASHSVLLNADKVPSQRYTREKQMLTLMYAEAAKNLELADFALKSSAPFIQIVDNAVPPLKMQPVSRFRLALSALLFGIAIGITLVIGRKFFRDAMAVG